MIDEIKPGFNHSDDIICYINSGDYEKEHAEKDGEPSFPEQTLYIAPITPCFNLQAIHELEKRLLAKFEKQLDRQIIFAPTSIYEGKSWVFGFGFITRCNKIISHLQLADRKINPEKLIVSIDMVIYPHPDLARNAMLYDFNKNVIDLQDLDYYKMESENEMEEHSGFFNSEISGYDN